jgi:hypothetical protein
MKTNLTVVVALGMVSFSGLASAAQKTEVEREIDAGLDLREKGHDREALEHFQKAYEMSRGARALAQMALAEQALGIWVDAEAHMKLALSSKDDKWIRANRQVLEGALNVIQRRLGSLEILGNVVGAEIRINGKPVGTLPLAEPIRALAGNAQVDVAADGYFPVSLTILIPATGLARETVTLNPRKTETVSASTPPVESPPKAPEGHAHLASSSTPPSSTSAPESQPTTAVTTSRSTSGAVDPLFAYLAGGGAVVGLGLGVIEMIVRNGHISNYNNDSMCLVNGRNRITNCGAEKSAADSAQTISAIGFVAGGAFAVGAVVLFVLSSSDSAEQKMSALDKGHGGIACGMGPGDVGIACGGAIDW